MNRISMGYIGVAINTFLLPIGQLFWKKALSEGYSIRVFFSLSFLLGALCYALGTVFWFFALSVFPFSKIYPFISLSYIVGAGLGLLFLNEHLTTTNLIGYFILIVALILLSSK